MISELVKSIRKAPTMGTVRKACGAGPYFSTSSSMQAIALAVIPSLQQRRCIGSTSFGGPGTPQVTRACPNYFVPADQPATDVAADQSGHRDAEGGGGEGHRGRARYAHLLEGSTEGQRGGRAARQRD